MKRAFVDTVFWIATLDPADALHDRATRVAARMVGTQLVTSDLVIIETMNAFCAGGPHLRKAVAELATRLRTQPHLMIVPQTTQLFDASFELFRSRLDKQWSFVDCSSFVIMKALAISDALTHDSDFRQAGYVPLLRDAGPDELS